MIRHDPYAPPGVQPHARPAVITWYRFYASAMALLYVACVVLGVVLFLGEEEVGLVVAVVSVALAIFYGVATFVPMKPWGWVVGVVAIGIGLSGCTFVASIPLLIKWVEPKTKAAFGRPPL